MICHRLNKLITLQKLLLTEFEDISLCTTDERMTIREAKYKNGYQVLSIIQPDENINVFTAVVGRGKQLINASDYLSYIKDGKVYLLLYLSKILLFTLIADILWSIRHVICWRTRGTMLSCENI